MKFKADKVSLLKDGSTRIVQFIVSEQDKFNVDNIIAKAKEYGELSVDITKYRNHRSLSANGLLWVMCEQIANAIRSNKDDVYIMMLKRYGQFVPMTTNKKYIEAIEQEWRAIEIIGEKEQEGHEIIKFLAYRGSSTYNTEEMSRLLDGVIDEAKDLGIETIDEIQLKSLMEEYERKEK